MVFCLAFYLDQLAAKTSEVEVNYYMVNDAADWLEEAKDFVTNVPKRLQQGFKNLGLQGAWEMELKQLPLMMWEDHMDLGVGTVLVGFSLKTGASRVLHFLSEAQMHR